MNFMNVEFKDDEKLYRAVYPPENKSIFWKMDGTLSSAAFKDPHGLSVERGNYRSDSDVIADMKKYFTGCIVSVFVEQCRIVNAYVEYKPTDRSVYHSEIHRNKEILLLSSSQCKFLSEHAKIECR